MTCTYELPESISRCGVVCNMYADGIKVCKTSESADDLYSTEVAVSYVEHSDNEWEPSPAAEKSKCFLVGASRIVESPSYKQVVSYCSLLMMLVTFGA